MNAYHYRTSRLYLESLLRQTPPTDERLYIGHKAAMDPANYQLVPAVQALGQPRPRILIADGVGLGKTLEAGILLSELIRRGRGRRILVVTLKSILSQFQEELWARFTIPLVRLDSVGIQRVQGKIPSNMNPFYFFDRVIISVDTLKKDEKYRRFLRDCHWDAIVIDECQHVAERASPTSSQLSQRARLARLLGSTCDALVMTSATPHDGRPESFASLMNLLEPTAVANPSDYTQDEIEGLCIRRFKKDVAHEVGGSFAERALFPAHIEASAAENEVFDALATAEFRTMQRRHLIDRHGRPKGKGVLFRTLLLKAFLSSPSACISTIGERLKNKRLADENLEDPHVAHDRKVLLELQSLAEAVTSTKHTKLTRLVDVLEHMNVCSESEDNRVVVFTERIDTLEYLQDELQKRLSLAKDQIAIFHGTLDDKKQQALVKDFGTKSSKVRILLASDAAAEGINLHFFCHRLIHFDIPWSLITLEQRNGRIDRFGQEHTPEIHYLLTIPKSEGLRGDLRVLDRLIEKEQAAHKNIGDAATLMRLYDAEAEADRVAEGISHHEKPSAIVPDEPEDFLVDLLGGEGAEQQDLFAAVPTADLLSLFPDDLDYVREGFAELAADDDSIAQPEWHEHLRGLTMTAAPDLQRRFTYLPPELLRDKDWEFRLTADRQLVQDALAESRQDAHKWPEWQLLWPQHPICEWLNDRVLASFRRHQAPVARVTSGLTGSEAAFVFQGILSNQRSQPVVVDWLAVVFAPKAPPRIVTLAELVEAGALDQRIPNPGREIPTKALDDQREPAVAAAREHMLSLRQSRADRLRGILKDQERRVLAWKQKANEQVKAQQRRWTAGGKALRKDQKRRLEAELDSIERRVESRRLWIADGLATVDQPYLRLAAVLVGPTFNGKVG